MNVIVTRKQRLPQEHFSKDATQTATPTERRVVKLRVREGSENKDTNSKNLPSPPNINRLGILCAAKHYFRSAVPTSHDVFRKIIIASVAVRVSFGYTAR